jgi:hypothetical protein
MHLFLPNLFFFGKKSINRSAHPPARETFTLPLHTGGKGVPQIFLMRRNLTEHGVEGTGLHRKLTPMLQENQKSRGECAEKDP